MSRPRPGRSGHGPRFLRRLGVPCTHAIFMARGRVPAPVKFLVLPGPARTVRRGSLASRCENEPGADDPADEVRSAPHRASGPSPLGTSYGHEDARRRRDSRGLRRNPRGRHRQSQGLLRGRAGEGPGPDPGQVMAEGRSRQVHQDHRLPPAPPAQREQLQGHPHAPEHRGGPGVAGQDARATGRGFAHRG